MNDLTLFGATDTSIDMSWTAPGDNGNTGTAASYDLRYSTSPITSGNFSSATQVLGVPAPQVAGTVQSMSVSGLVASTTYYFAIKTSDAAGNVSSISNVPSLSTTATGTFGPNDTGKRLLGGAELSGFRPGVSRLHDTGVAQEHEPISRRRQLPVKMFKRQSRRQSFV